MKEMPPKESDSRIAGLESRLAEMEMRLGEATEALRVIRNGGVDSLIVSGPNGPQVFSLQGAETPYRLLIEEMNEGALLVAVEGTILYANARFAELAGVPFEQAAGWRVDRYFEPSDWPRLAELLKAARSGGVRGEFNLAGKEGFARPVQVSVSPMDRHGVTGYVVVLADLTERKAAEAAVYTANDRLREVVSELEHFSYSITHDMRAPLRAMQGFASVLEEECAGCAQFQGQYLARLKAAAGRLDMLIRDSLDYAKAVRHEIPVSPVQLAPILHGLIETYPNLQAERADIEVCEPLPTVLGDVAALTQCFGNLLGNAVKFVDHGVRPKVRVWAEEPVNGMARIWVVDNGIGIPKEFIPRAFDMFSRASREFDGTGIGLAIVRKVVQRMGGGVGVESEPNQGSRFWVELRAAPDVQ